MWEVFKWQTLGIQHWAKIHRLPSLTGPGVNQGGLTVIGWHNKGKGSPTTGRRTMYTAGASRSRADARKELGRLPWRGGTWAETRKIMRDRVEADPGEWPMSGEKGKPKFLKLQLSCCIYQWWLLSNLWTSCFVKLYTSFLFKLIWVGGLLQGQTN